MTETVGKRIISTFIAIKPHKAMGIALSVVLCFFFSIGFLFNPINLFAQGSHFRIKTVVIDAGHGGKDPGNIGTGRYKDTEADVVLDVSLILGKYIEEQFPDVKVIYTRKTDVFIGLNERAKIANDNGADLFISIHCNAFKKQESHGTESWVMGMHKSEENLRIAQQENSAIFLEEDYETKYEGFDPNSIESYIILSMIQSNNIESSISMANLVQKQFKSRVQRVDRGVKQAGFVVISKTTMPSVLIEIGFLTNKEEEDFLNSNKGKDYIASAIFRAFKEYKGLHETAAIEAGVSEAKGPTEEQKKKEEEAAAKKKAEAEAKAKADSIAKAKEEAAKKKAEEEARLKEEQKKKAEAEKRAKAKADSIAKVEAEKKSKHISDSIAKEEAKKAVEEARLKELAKVKADSIAQVEAAKKAKELAEKHRADSIAKAKAELKARIDEAARKKAEREKVEAAQAKARQDSIDRVEAEKKKAEMAVLIEKAKKDSIAKSQDMSEMQKQQALWSTVDELQGMALESRADFEKYIDAAIKLDDYLWQQSGEKDKTPEWGNRRSKKEYQKIYYAFELGAGQNVETFKALTLLFPEGAKYVDERAFAMYEQYINDKIRFEKNGNNYEAISYEKIIDASLNTLKVELQSDADKRAVAIADSMANADKGREERLRAKRDSLKNELAKFREERIEAEPKPENAKKEDKKFEERKEDLLKKIKPGTETIAGNKNITFRVQLVSSPKSLASNAAVFKGVSVDEYIDNGTYKYTTGNAKSIDEATGIQRDMRKKGFSDAFVVAFLNGERIPVSKAREILGID